MSFPTKDNKENFRLLYLSTSDEESEDLNLQIAPIKKKKVSRKDRHRASEKGPYKTTDKPVLKYAIQWVTRILLFFWLVTLTWLTVALYDQITSMHTEWTTVSTSSKGVSDSLQYCHTAAKELRFNVTDLNDRLDNLEVAHKELVQRVDQATEELKAVSQQLAAAPKLADTPRRLAELQRTVADFGSQINGFDGALTSSRKQAVAATTGLEELKKSLHELEARTNETIANSTINAQKDDELRQQINNINSTLLSRIDFLQTSLNDSIKMLSTAVNTTSATITGSSSTSTTQPGPPAKPSVTQ